MKNIFEKITEKIQSIQDRLVTKPLWQVVLGLFLFLISIYLFVFSFWGGLYSSKFWISSFLSSNFGINLSLSGIQNLVPEYSVQNNEQNRFLLVIMRLYLDGAIFGFSLNILIFCYLWLLRKQTWKLVWFDVLLVPLIWAYINFLDDIFRVSMLHKNPDIYFFYGKILWLVLLLELVFFFFSFLLLFKDKIWGYQTKLSLAVLFLCLGYFIGINTFGILGEEYIQTFYQNFPEDFIFSWVVTNYGLGGIICFCMSEEEYIKKQCSWEKWWRDSTCKAAKRIQKVNVPQGAHPEYKTIAHTLKGGSLGSCSGLEYIYKECLKQSREEYKKSNPVDKK